MQTASFDQTAFLWKRFPSFGAFDSTHECPSAANEHSAVGQNGQARLTPVVLTQHSPEVIRNVKRLEHCFTAR
jgi:hypothetical protein